MSNPTKTAKIPVESHGKHKHDTNVPALFTSNFFEHIPVFHRDYSDGDRIKERYSFYNRLNPLPVPALVTGSTKVFGFYVPYESFFKGWHDFVARVEHNFSDGTSAVISSGRYISMSILSKTFVTNTDLCIVGTSSDYDVVFVDTSNVLSYYKFTSFGAALYKLLCALGLTPSWNENDTLEPNCHKALAYIRLMYDHFFPLQYVGNSVSQNIMNMLNADTVSSLHVSESDLLDLLGHVFYGWFDSSWIESAWDRPVTPNAGSGVGSISITDSTNNNSPQIVTNVPSQVSSPSNVSYKPSNDTPFVGGSASAGGSPTGVLTQFVIDALQSVNNFLKRRGLSGNRLIENYLSQRGVSLPSGIYHESLKLDEYSVPFEVVDVENNSDVNLGELAGKAVTSAKDLKFEHRFDRDGIFFVIQAAIPDAEPLLAFDPYNLCKSPFDFHRPAFEKLGVEAVSSRILYQDQSGVHNAAVNSQVFGFFKRYFYGNVDFAREFGDFRVLSRGSQSLAQYHTFRSLYPYISANNYTVAHSYDLLRVGNDYSQFSRIFYTGKQDNMVVVARLKGSRWTNFLPFGDSYDWDDDEMNEKVVVQNSGNDSI